MKTKLTKLLLATMMLLASASAMAQNAATGFPFLLGAAKGAQNEIVPLMTYTLGQNAGSVPVNGTVTNFPMSETFARFETRPDSDHPDGFAYIWVYDDVSNVYFVCDWTSDNTYDDGEDYFTVHINDGAGLKSYTQHSDGGEYGIALFDYTNIVDYQHMYYVIAVPKAELSSNKLELGFEMYGTAAISGNYTWAKTPPGKVAPGENVDFTMHYEMTLVGYEKLANQVAIMFAYNDNSELNISWIYAKEGVLYKTRYENGTTYYDKLELLDYNFYNTGLVETTQEPLTGDIPFGTSFERGAYKIAVMVFYEYSSYSGYVEYRRYGNLLVAELAVNTANAPNAPANFKANPVGYLKTELSWKNPIQTFGGAPLKNLDRIVLKRDNNIIKEFTGVMPGSAMTFTDTAPEAGIYNYEIYAVNADGQSISAFEKNVDVFVLKITDVPYAMVIGTPLELTGKVLPESAPNKEIVWSIKNAGNTGATLTGNTFEASKTGLATISATIANGLGDGEDYVQDFKIYVCVSVTPYTVADVVNNVYTDFPNRGKIIYTINGTEQNELFYDKHENGTVTIVRNNGEPETTSAADIDWSNIAVVVEHFFPGATIKTWQTVSVFIAADRQENVMVRQEIGGGIYYTYIDGVLVAVTEYYLYLGMGAVTTNEYERFDEVTIQLMSTGIGNISSEPARIMGYYNIMGIKLDKEPEKGLYIILYDNGKAEKRVK